MTWLILASEQDMTAHWAAERLHIRGLSPLTVITDTDLAGASWQHRIGDHTASTRIRLRDGRTIDSDNIQGTLNRLTHIPHASVIALREEDRIYALQEITALTLSWLHSLPEPVLNPPDPRGLCGAWRPVSEWALLAYEAGLDTRSLSSTSDWPEDPLGRHLYSADADDVIVVGNEVFAKLQLNSRTIDACRLLAERANSPILGLSFVGERFVNATPLPNLHAGGDDLIAALAHELGAP